MRHVVRLLVVLAALTLGQRAEAQVVSFNEQSPTENPILGQVVCADTTGFRFSSDHFHLTGLAFAQDYTHNGTTHIGYESGRGDPILMERVGGGTFSLLSLDVAEFYAVNVPDRPDAQMIQIVGTQQGGGVVSHTFNLDGLKDGPGGVVDFEHFVLPGTFVNLVSVEFTGLRTGGASGGIAVDNIQYSLPQPETLAPCVAIPVDAGAPTVTFVSPAPGNVAGTVLVEASATDNVGVTSVQFRVDGVALGAADTIAPYAVSWDTNTVPDGAHTLTAEARDGDGNVTTATLGVTVQNQPVNNDNPYFLDLDGTDDYVQVADANALSFGNGAADTPMSIELWIRPDAMTRHLLVGKWVSGANSEYRMHISSGVIRLDLRDVSANAQVSAYTTNSQAALAGAWHHVAATYDGRGGATAANGITIYVDGVAVPLTRINSASYVAMENLTAPVQIGREGPGWMLYNGGLDEVRLWSVARSASQVQSAMAMELAGTEPGLAAYWRFNEGTGSTVADDSPGSLTATLFGPVWMPGGPFDSGEPDTTPPQISNIAVGSLTATGATITFTTSEAATSWVSYTATTCPCTSVYSPINGTQHTVNLSGLTPNTQYTYTVNATDAANNTATSASQIFQTPATPGDTTPPTVSITAPAAGPVSGTVQVSANAADNVGVTSVQFKLDGVNLGSADTSAPYGISWNTTTASEGSHTLTAEARDAANNVTTSSSVVVVVDNQPDTSSPFYLDLDGVNDALQATDANALSFGNGAADTALTLEAWIRPDVMNRQQQLIGKWTLGANTEYRLYIAANIIRLDLRDASANAQVSVYTTNSQAALVGAWHHVAATYDGRGGATAADGVTIYIDGVSLPLTRVNNAAYVAMENTPADLQFGRETNGDKQYDGGLDEVRMWNVARTATQVQTSRNTALTGTEPGLVGYWRFNAGTGTTVADDSPNSHTATLVNGPVWVAGGAPLQ